MIKAWYSMSCRSLFLCAPFLVLTTFVGSAQAEVLDGTGNRGQDGRNGQSNSTSPRSAGGCYAQDGGDGGDAGSATRGGKGANFVLNMKDTDRILVTGQKTTFPGQSTQNIETAINLTGAISVLANGGRGGDGGDGGDGEGAQHGQDSSDHARENHRGGDGCDASSPGDGGDSTPGERGGESGDIVIRIAEADSHILMSVQTETNGGQGGNGGRNGRAGDRARGGSGGNSWSETRRERTGRQINEPGCTPRSASSGTRVVGKDDQGFDIVQGYTIPAVTCRQVDEYEYNIYSSPGGSDGRDSPSASSGRGSESDGSRGNSGTTVFEVVAEDGSIKRYSSLYNLEVVSYETEDNNNDGIYEPNESVIIKNLRIRNRGEMGYAFAKAKTIFSLQSAEWILADPVELEIPEIAAGQTLTIADPKLSFKIRNNKFAAASGRPQWSETIVPTNRITRIQKSFQGLNLAKTFSITYPVEFSEIKFPKTASAGSEETIAWTIKNIGNKEIPEFGDLAREMGGSIAYLGGDLPLNQLNVTSSGTNVPMESSAIQWVQGLRPNEVRGFSGTIQISDKAQLYTAADFAFQLYINDYKEANLTKIQHQVFGMKITQTYQTRSGDDVLLVIDPTTDRQNYLDWTSLFSTLGLNYNLWDLDEDGYMSFSKAFKNGGSLANDFSQKTVIFKNLPSGSQEIPESIREAHLQLFGVAHSDGLNSYLIGEGDLNQQAQLVKNLRSPHVQNYDEPDFKGFLENLKKMSTFDENVTYTIPIRESYFFVRKPRKDLLDERRKELIEALAAKFPGESFHTETDFAPKLLKVSVFGDTYSLGSILVRKGLAASRNRIVMLPQFVSNIKSPDFIKSESNVKGLCLSLSAKSRKKAFSAILNNSALDLKYQQVFLECSLYQIVSSILDKAEINSFDGDLESLFSVYEMMSEKTKAQALQVVGSLSLLLDKSKARSLTDQKEMQKRLAQKVKTYLSPKESIAVETSSKILWTRIKGLSKTTDQPAESLLKKIVLKKSKGRLQVLENQAYEN